MTRTNRSRSRRRSRSRARRRSISRNQRHVIQEEMGSAQSFECQLAHGSPIVKIQSFSTIYEMYQRIADCFDGLDADDILYCTLNTSTVDMDRLATTDLKSDDRIFVHVKGKTKQVKFVKDSEAIGITMSVIRAGKTLITKIRTDSQASKIPEFQVGDCIEEINGAPMNDISHAWEAAKIIRNLPLEKVITMTLIEPLKSGESGIPSIESSGENVKETIFNDCVRTFRFKSTVDAELQEAPNKQIIIRMNEVFDSYLGINDDELAFFTWEICRDCEDLTEMIQKICQSKLSEFGFSDEMISDMWGIIVDWKNGLLDSSNKSAETPKMDEAGCVHHFEHQIKK